MKKRLVSIITALVMLAFTAINQGVSGGTEQTGNSAFTITSQAADIVIYGGDTMSTFSDRTAESGEYISIYYSSDNSYDTAYACSTIQALTLKHNYSSPSITKQATDNARGTLTRKCQTCGQTETKGFVGSKRLAGDNRFKTAAEISKAEFTTAKTVILAYGMNYADALAGGILAAKKAAPLLLTANSLSDEQAAYLKAKELNCIYVFGGTGAVSADIVDKITKAAATN